MEVKWSLETCIYLALEQVLPIVHQPWHFWLKRIDGRTDICIQLLSPSFTTPSSKPSFRPPDLYNQFAGKSPKDSKKELYHYWVAKQPPKTTQSCLMFCNISSIGDLQGSHWKFTYCAGIHNHLDEQQC